MITMKEQKLGGGFRSCRKARHGNFFGMQPLRGDQDFALFPMSRKKGWTIHFKLVMKRVCRDVAQLGRALRSGRRSRAFKSRHPDHFLSN